MSNALVFTGIFEDVEGEYTFEAKVGLDVASYAPAGFSDFFYAVSSFDGEPEEEDDVEERTFNGTVYSDVVEVLDDYLDYFEISWVDPEVEETVLLENLDWVTVVY